MPKLILPATEPDSIEVRQYTRGTARHVRALAKYLYERLPSNVLTSLMYALLPHLEDHQIRNVIDVRLPRVTQMNLEQIEEIMKGTRR